MKIRLFGTALASLMAMACGGSTPAPLASPTAPPVSASSGAEPTATEPAKDADAGVKASNVRFDDLGMSVVVPPGFHVVGDGELAARVEASSNPRVIDAIRRSLKTRRSMPLLSLTRDAGADWVSVTISIVSVPSDARAEEIMAQQSVIMQKHFAEFAVTNPAHAYTKDGVDASRMECTYRHKDRAVASSLRVFVRNDLAFLVTALRAPDATEGAERARAIVDGVTFYPPI